MEHLSSITSSVLWDAAKKTDIPWLIEEGLFFKETREIHFKLYQSLIKIFNFIHASWP